MPCHDPRDDVRWADVERVRDEEQAHYDKLHSEYSKLIDLMCETCTHMEATGDSKYLDNSPELRMWWEAHKKEDEARAERERTTLVSSKLAVRAAIDYIETYTEILKNKGLSANDKSHFEDKIASLKREISEIFARFPAIAKDYS